MKTYQEGDTRELIVQDLQMNQRKEVSFADTTESKEALHYQIKKEETCPMASAMQGRCPFSGTTEGFRMRPQDPKYLRLMNWVEGKEMVDTLHQKATNPLHCTNGRCTGSVMFPYGGETPKQRPYGVPRDKEEVKIDAQDFFQQYFTSTNRSNSDNYQNRMAEVMKSVEETGTYQMTEKELIFAAKTAWRNAPRCIGRIQWNNLQVFDARHVTTAKEMFEVLKKHLEYATNGGNLRSVITIFPQRREQHKDFRVWNSLLIQYAGYRQPDGTVIGDPAGVEFTEICESLGWKGKGGRFDVLPIVLQANGGTPEFFEIPDNLVLRVKIKHPKYPWFEKLGLQWYALPVVANMMLDAGGLEFTGAPFSGWYMVTEIGARDLGDQQRYNMLEVIANKMELDTRSNASLWKDFALVELNYAVMYSFQEAGVTIADHHSTSESFIKHMKKEMKLRGGCPADWVWIVPPMSGSATQVFHQEMLNYVLKPCYGYQISPWKVHSGKKISFKAVSRAVRFAAFLMRKVLSKRKKATILFATETGKSEGFARNLAKLMGHTFDAKVLCMDEYEHAQLTQETLLFVVTSTFGNGESPENGTSFTSYLERMKNSIDARPLKNMRYSVFGLGSRLYPNFCAFGHYVDKHLKDLGAQKILAIGEGDEQNGQEESFKEWTKNVFKAACDSFGVNDEAASKVVSESLKKMVTGWSPGLYRWVNERRSPNDLFSNLSKVYNKTVCPATVISVSELQSEPSSRSTVLVKLATGKRKDLAFEPGDHVAIFPSNKASLVQELIDMMHGKPDPNRPIRIEVAREDSAKAGGGKVWEPFNRLPVGCTLKEALTRYLDITSVPTPQMLSYLAKLATSPLEKMQLETLGKGGSRYKNWALNKECNVIETMQEFPSVQVTADLLLTQLSTLQPRFYSISSSPDVHSNEIHVTAAVVEYNKRGGEGPLHHGVCSKWLQGLRRGETIPCYIRQAHSFRLPVDGSAPVILVGNGTGIAPFRSFWQQRIFDLNNKCPPVSSITGKRQWGDMVLYFGCRNSRLDDIYRRETEKVVHSRALTGVATAYSREKGKPKQYVQDLLKEHSSDVCDLILNSNAHVYVCGAAAMAEGVNDTLQALITDRLKLSPDKAVEFMSKLKSSNRYHEDIFGFAQRIKEPKDMRKQIKKGEL
ncbi:nitric oxide synthase 1-like isoform X2 [Montipora capricornis]|uniref:nitric oxide synthase 1-like isoform X2 n=1 Tax=Montipora capricornis TaxID=246305 RepID=UPI0035F134AF